MTLQKLKSAFSGLKYLPGMVLSLFESTSCRPKFLTSFWGTTPPAIQEKQTTNNKQQTTNNKKPVNYRENVPLRC
ncbi:MAG: hypothetical protein ACLFV6_11195, partial [Spirulinaceae cyanobacterium]